MYGVLHDTKYFDPKNSSNLTSEIIVALQNDLVTKDTKVKEFNILIGMKNDYYAKKILNFIS